VGAIDEVQLPQDPQPEQERPQDGAPPPPPRAEAPPLKAEAALQPRASTGRLLVTLAVVTSSAIVNRVMYKMALVPLGDHIFFLVRPPAPLPPPDCPPPPPRQPRAPRVRPLRAVCLNNAFKGTLQMCRQVCVRVWDRRPSLHTRAPPKNKGTAPCRCLQSQLQTGAYLLVYFGVLALRYR
jgi:hypothetical protein